MDESKLFLTGDLHLGHKRILTYEKEYRNYSTIEAMHEAIIYNWNKKIKATDKTMILGDLTFTNQKNTTDIISKLNGIKYLIKGNHDVRTNQWYRDCGIKEVYDYPIIINNYFLLSHEPFLYLKEPFINIHAHVHSSKNFLTFTPTSVCVSMERWGMSPVSLLTIMLNRERLERRLEKTMQSFTKDLNIVKGEQK